MAIGFFVVSGAGMPQAAIAQTADAAAAGFQFKEASDASLGLWEGDRPVLVYNHGDVEPTDGSKTHAHSNYVHPLYGMDGEVLTDDFPRDHVHHRGLHWAWPHVRVGDDSREYSLWKYEGIRYRFEKWLAKEVAERAKLGVENSWVVGDRAVVKEEAWLEVHPATEEGRAIDVTLTWTPEESITLWGAEGKSYGGLVLRYAPRRKTIITVPEGRTTEDLLITKLPWVDLSGDFKGTRGWGFAGAAIFVHPDHPDFPPEWMTRDYGVLAVGWPGVKSKTLPAGEPVTCRYRVWIHRGVPDTVAEIEKAYDAYRGEAAREKSP